MDNYLINNAFCYTDLITRLKQLYSLYPMDTEICLPGNFFRDILLFVFSDYPLHDPK